MLKQRAIDDNQQFSNSKPALVRLEWPKSERKLPRVPYLYYPAGTWDNTLKFETPGLYLGQREGPGDSCARGPVVRIIIPKGPHTPQQAAAACSMHAARPDMSLSLLMIVSERSKSMCSTPFEVYVLRGQLYSGILSALCIVGAI